MTQPTIQIARNVEGDDDLTFALSNTHFAYVFRVSPEGVLEHIYYGAPVAEPLLVTRHHIRTQRETASVYQGGPFFSLGDTPQEYPGFGTSDYRFPALHGRNSDGNTIFSLQYQGHAVTDAKPDLSPLPAARGDGSQTLTLTLADPLHGLEVRLHYTIWPDHGVLARSTTFHNTSEREIQLQHAFSSSLDLPAADPGEGYDLIHLHGTWAREFTVERTPMPTGRFVVDSARGTSSAAHNPFLAVVERDTTETRGRVYASTLVYSGNHALSAEMGEFKDVRILVGINPFNFHWRIKPGESFQTPEALHVFSEAGLSGMSAHWHGFIRAHILPQRFRDLPRPTYLNTWEAAYFDIDEDKVLDLADRAVELDVDMLVLDDGWFAGRRDDTSSLGDWTPDAGRFPSGIPTLGGRVRAKGLKFGIWFEPEMVSPDSDLYRAHPEWALHVPGRKPSLGRNQLTLDLSREDVRDYLFDRIDAVLASGEVDYVKWDMNRSMTEVGSAAVPPRQQRETSHRYMLGLYTLLARLIRAHPDVLFENCASGGNRFDLGMMTYMAQGWISDMCDPVGRLRIVSGASLIYPLDSMAAYIGPSPNHQNGRVTSLRTRFLAGVFCSARGVSLGAADIANNLEELRGYVEFAKLSAPDMLGGRFERLVSADNTVAWQYTTSDASTVYLADFHILAAPNLPFRRARLRGLDADATYTLRDDAHGLSDLGPTIGKSSFRGDVLMQSGMPLPHVTMSQVRADVRYARPGDFSAHLFIFDRN